ncbi:DUF1700 domain-containing protein [Bacillus sp. JJ1503]|uniref:HAAS signaling domain-containing protein n=1 Tax=Bacillus sp. JJ1503 TaxID=3122956 RepID=UPI002FFF1B25
MNKESYLRELQRKLRKLPDEEVIAALDYYSEYFDEAGVENTQYVIEKLVSPAQVAGAYSSSSNLMFHIQLLVLLFLR